MFLYILLAIFTGVAVGTFTGLLANLPKSGWWTEAIKKVCGFLLILVGEYFLLEAGKLLL